MWFEQFLKDVAGWAIIIFLIFGVLLIISDIGQTISDIIGSLRKRR